MVSLEVLLDTMHLGMVLSVVMVPLETVEVLVKVDSPEKVALYRFIENPKLNQTKVKCRLYLPITYRL